MNREALAQAVLTVIADHPMWIGDDGQALDYSPRREDLIGDFIYEAADAILVAENAKASTGRSEHRLQIDWPNELVSCSCGWGGDRDTTTRDFDAHISAVLRAALDPS